MILDKPHNTNMPTYSFLPLSADCLFRLLQVILLVNTFLQGVEEVKDVTKVVKAVVIAVVSGS